jgi:choline-sulfatase
VKRTRTTPVARITILLLILSRLLLAGSVPPKRAPGHPNVILITIDTLRADHLGCYGYKEIQTPTIDALAHDGVLFKHAISQVPLTWPSHAAILTGTYPFQNGVQDFTGHPLSPQFRSVAQAFQQAGYATGAVVSSFVLDRSWGLARGFDYYDDAFSAETFRQKDIGLVDRKAQESVSHALAWLKRTPKRPFFLWLHLYDPHSPYDPPEPFRTQYRDHLYDGEIASADHELSRLILWLKQTGIYDRSLIVLLSDHGESLGEHGESEHGFFIYNSTIHIPLIVKAPVRSGFSLDPVDRPVETIAVAPTLLHLGGVHDKIEDQFQAQNVFDRGANGNDSAYSETFYPFSSFGWAPLHSLETGRYHYIDAPRVELYDLVADPEESKNIATSQPEITAVLKDKLRQRLQSGALASPEKDGNLSPDAAQKLRALGYAAYRSPVSSEALARSLPDPKDKLGEFNSILQAQDAFRARRFDAGKQLLDKIAELDPQMYVVPFLLGEASLRQENWGDAAAKLKHCLELNPNFDEAMTGLSHALHAQGNDSEAKMWLDKALSSDPRNYRAWYELGNLQARADPSAALEAYKRALSIQPNFAQGQRDLGILEVAQKQYPEASKHLEQALSFGLDDARLRNFLGIAYTQSGQLRRAVKSLQQAIRQDPNLAEAHLNLGFAYQKLHRPDVAKVEYDTACRLQSRFCARAPSPN